MKYTTIFFSVIIMTGISFAPFAYALTPTSSDPKQVAEYENDTKIKKYNLQLTKLRAEIEKLQKEYFEINKLKNERIKQLMPVSQQKPGITDLNAVKKLAEFPLAGKTWRDRFYQTGTPPLNAFKVFYFNTTSPTKSVASSQVSSIDINYAWQDGPGFKIDSEDFGAYWIGDFTLAKDEVMLLDLSQSWSETRVIIDGHLIYKGGNNNSLKINIPKGQHTLEVEYVNNWHTVEFSASLRTVLDVPKVISTSEIEKINHKEVWYAGVYESGAANKTIRLVPKSSNTVPKILFLSSYASVKWDATLLKNSGITTIIYSSHAPGAQMINLPQGISVYTIKIPYGYTLKASCSTNDRNGLLGCGDIDEFTSVYNAITKLTTKPLTGFSGAYSPTELTLPGTVLTSTIIKDALANPVKLRAESAKYLESQKIDNIF